MPEFQDDEQALTGEFVASLVQTYQIPADRVARFATELNLFCARFIEQRAVKKQHGSLAEQHKVLAKLSTESAQFRDFIDELAVPILEIVNTATHETNRERFDIEYEIFEAENGQVSPPDPDESFLNLRLLRAQLNLLIEGSQYAQQVELDQPTRGQSIDTNLEEWIANMRLVWRTSTGKPFTRDDYKGAANSPASQFCVDVCALIAPDITERRILNTMKKRITEDRKNPYWQN